MGTTWKAVERAICKLFGTERTGPLGERWPDGISDAYAIEVKHRDSLPLWLKDAVEQAQENGVLRCPEKLPIVVLHEKGGEYLQSIVIVPTVEQFLDWFGE